MEKKIKADYLEALRIANEIYQEACKQNLVRTECGGALPVEARRIEILARNNFVAITAAKIFDEIKDREDECRFP